MTKKRFIGYVSEAQPVSWWGWTKERAGWQIHKLGSVLGTLALSAGLSGYHAAVPNDKPEWPLRATMTGADDHTEALQTTASTTRQITETTVSRVKIGSTPAQDRIEPKVVSVTMPASYDLILDTPEESRILNEDDYTTLVQEIAQAVNNGALMKSIEFYGMASDEVNHRGDAQLGEHNNANDALAISRAQYIAARMITALHQQGVDTTNLDNTVHMSGSEQILSALELEIVQDIQIRYGYMSKGLLLKDYKENPNNPLSDDDRQKLWEIFDLSRGVEIVAIFEEPLPERAVYRDTIETRCVNDITVIIDTTYNTVQQKKVITLYFVPFALPHRTRRREWIEDESQEDYLRATSIDGITGTDTFDTVIDGNVNINLASQKGSGDMPEANPDVMVDSRANPVTIDDLYMQSSILHRQYIKSLFRHIRFLEQLQKQRHMSVTEREIQETKNKISALQETLDAYYRNNAKDIKRKQRLGRIVIAAFLALPLFIKGDAGYCPDTSMIGEQSWPQHGLVPDRLDLGLGIPFTDAHDTGKLPVWDARCIEPTIGTAVDATPPGPTCDTRTTVIKDSEIVRRDETHHPSAITVTSKISIE